MPLLPSITLHTDDLNEINETLSSKQHRGAVKIVDEGRQIILRDINDFKLGSIKKNISNEKTGTTVSKR